MLKSAACGGRTFAAPIGLWLSRRWRRLLVIVKHFDQKGEPCRVASTLGRPASPLWPRESVSSAIGCSCSTVDLAEIGSLFGRGIWSTQGPAVARFRRTDHLGPASQSLDDSVRDLVQSKIGWRPDGPIRLLTYFSAISASASTRSVSIHRFDADGQCVQAVVAEVNSTPWNEQHCYVLDLRGSLRKDGSRQSLMTSIQPEGVSRLAVSGDGDGISLAAVSPG